MGILFVWSGQALYFGLGMHSKLHRHHAFQVGVALEPGLWVGRGDVLEPCYGFAVAPDIPHQVNAEGLCTLLVWSEREGMRPKGPALRLFAQPTVAALQAKLKGLRPYALDCAGARVLLEEVLHTLVGSPLATTLDPRVSAVIQIAKMEVLEPRPIARLARHSGLSANRLRHLFREQTGLSLQRYLLWQRLLHALELTSGGLPLTEAAHAAGFADSSHLTRVYRDTFGLKPSAVFGSRSVQVRLCRGL